MLPTCPYPGRQTHSPEPLTDNTLVKKEQQNPRCRFYILHRKGKGTFQAFCLINNFRAYDLEYSNLSAINYPVSATVLLVRHPLREVSLTHLDKIVPTLFMMYDQRAKDTKREREKHKPISRKQFQDFSSTLISKMAHLIHEHL